jgi:hypothetical protein
LILQNQTCLYKLYGQPICFLVNLSVFFKGMWNHRFNNSCYILLFYKLQVKIAFFFAFYRCLKFAILLDSIVLYVRDLLKDIKVILAYNNMRHLNIPHTTHYQTRAPNGSGWVGFELDLYLIWKFGLGQVGYFFLELQIWPDLWPGIFSGRVRVRLWVIYNDLALS